MNNRYMTAEEAAQSLDISVSTLYSYVSRGMIRSEPVEDGSRKRRYYREDVEALMLKKQASRLPEKLTEAALHFGTPVTESAITLINEGQFYYRGENAVTLAQTDTLEQIAGRLWLDDAQAGDMLFQQPPHPQTAKLTRLYSELSEHTVNGIGKLHVLQAIIAIAANDDLAAHDLSPEAVARTGARIMRLAVDVVTGTQTSQGGLAAALAHAWHVNEADLLNTAMVLCADHELNASSFAARVAASTRATPYACVIAGLSAFSGVKHGGYTERVNALFQEIENVGNVQTVLAARLQRGEDIPGFGHRLYPHGDPRARLLLGLIYSQYLTHPMTDHIRTLETTAANILNEYPVVDYGISAMCHVLEIERSNSLLLYAIARMAGWVGQSIEQYQSDKLIRPRATYTGRNPI